MCFGDLLLLLEIDKSMSEQIISTQKWPVIVHNLRNFELIEEELLLPLVLVSVREKCQNTRTFRIN